MAVQVPFLLRRFLLSLRMITHHHPCNLAYIEVGLQLLLPLALTFPCSPAFFSIGGRLYSLGPQICKCYLMI